MSSDDRYEHTKEGDQRLQRPVLECSKKNGGQMSEVCLALPGWSGGRRGGGGGGGNGWS